MTDEKNKWVEFLRVQCVDGHIDIWTGDCADDPNNPKKMGYNLNSSATYYRLTDKWIRSHNFNRFFRGNIVAYRDTLTAAEIWNQNFEERTEVYLLRPVLIPDGATIESGLYMATIREGFAFLGQHPEYGITLEWIEKRTQ